MTKNEKSAKSLPENGDKPHQPNSNFKFKKREISGQNRYFQHKWFSEFPWIHYNESEDKAYCFHCIKCIKENLKGDKKTLEIHIETVHEGLKPYKCGQCEKTFGTKSQASIHKNEKHLNIRRYQCSVCKTDLFRKETLRKHLKNKHNLNPETYL